MSRVEGKRSRRREEEDDNGLDALLNASDEYVPYVPLKQRKMGGGAVQIDNSDVTRDDENGKTTEDEAEETEKSTAVKPAAKKTLLDVKEEMKKRHETMDAKSIKLEQQKVEEQRILLEVRLFIKRRDSGFHFRAYH